MKNRAAVNQFTTEPQHEAQFCNETPYISTCWEIPEEQLMMVAGGQVVVNTV